MNELNIDTLLFDWGGVFQRTTDYAPRLELAQELGVDEPALENRVFNHPIMMSASLGKLSAEDAWQTIARDLAFTGDWKTFVNHFFAGDSIDPQLISLVKWLRNRSLKVGLLSNAPASVSTGQGMAGRWGMEALFDAQVFSYQVGVHKPDPRTFTAALDALQAPANTTVFIDDMFENIQGAKAAGLNALLFQNTAQLLADLRSLGICVPDISELS